MTEFTLYTPIAVAASKVGARIFRNHVGMALQKTSETPMHWRPPHWLVPVKIGLVPGSADFVGWAPYVVRAEDVGKTLAVFASVEVKPPEWRETDQWRASNQGLWLDTVRRSGGIAGVAQSPEGAAGFLTQGPIWAR